MATVTSTRSNGTRGKTAVTKAPVPTSEIGVTGLKHVGGYIVEERLHELDSWRGVCTYAEMETDAIVGGVLQAITSEIRRVNWDMEAADDSPEAAEAAEFVDQCRDDMSESWPDFVTEAFSMLPYGWALHETVFKVRRGEVANNPGASSKYSDGRWGWRKMPIRSQDSLDRWEFDDEGGIAGMWQRDPNSFGGGYYFLPIDRCLLFRPIAHKNNPLGRSVLRAAYISWYRRKRTQEAEAIGIDRDLVGIPVFDVPAEWLTGAATSEQAAALDNFKRIGEQLRVDEQACVLMPQAYDAMGNKMFDLHLMPSPGTKTMNIGDTIHRLNMEIAVTVLADVVLIGHDATGSFALSKEKYDAFTRGLEAWVQAFAAVMNRHAIPRLCQVNNIPLALAPTLCPEPIERVDLDAMGRFITALAGAGYPLFPDGELEAHLARIAGMPYTPPDQRPETAMPAPAPGQQPPPPVGEPSADPAAGDMGETAPPEPATTGAAA
jgi:hypothetical protein